jgi:ribosomal protein S12 methylthiotransferase
VGPQPASPTSVYVVTLGCPKNDADSRAVVRSLLSAGVALADAPEQASHILINTCGFIRDAKEESIAAILEACAGYPDKQVLVMGCLVERYRDELAEGIPEVAGWFGLAGGPDEAGLLWSLSKGAPEVASRGGGSRARSYAYLKISDGCDELCTFCAIPAIKGPYHSVTAAEILREADACLTEGARELVLVGQDTAVWRDGSLDLAGLIEHLAVDDRLRRVRVMYLQPEHVTDAFLDYMAGQPKLCRYLDVPFQHSHPDILRAMGRWGSGDDYLALLARARRLMPDVSVRSTFIVGFPGEKEEHFEHLLGFVEDAGFDHAGGFVYSPEEGTKATKLRPRVRPAAARERLNRLTAILEARSEREHRRMVGSRVEVLIDSLDPEETGEGMAAVGRTPGQAPEVDGLTHVAGDLPEGTRPGDVLGATVSDTVGYDLFATL